MGVSPTDRREADHVVVPEAWLDHLSTIQGPSETIGLDNIDVG